MSVATVGLSLAWASLITSDNVLALSKSHSSSAKANGSSQEKARRIKTQKTRTAFVQRNEGDSGRHMPSASTSIRFPLLLQKHVCSRESAPVFVERWKYNSNFSDMELKLQPLSYIQQFGNSWSERRGK